ncbi:MAG: hypothetical protein ACI9X0_002648, partial [Kiritimatiellia bacterium]
QVPKYPSTQVPKYPNTQIPKYPSTQGMTRPECRMAKPEQDLLLFWGFWIWDFFG